MENFHYAITLANLLYEVEGDTEDLEEIGLVAWRHIGNRNTHLYRAIARVDHDGKIELPCNCDPDYIEAVCYIGPEDWKYTSNIYNFGDFKSLYTEDYIEAHKLFLDPIYTRGKYVKYRREGNALYTNKGFGLVAILYHGLILDEEGLPELNEKEALAIADYIAYTQKYKEAIRTNNQVTFQIANDIKQKWLFHCDAARVPEFVNQNEMNMILDAQSSWNQKRKNFSYKPTL